MLFSILEQIFATCNSFPFPKFRFRNFKNFSFLKAVNFDQSEKHRTVNHILEMQTEYTRCGLTVLVVYLYHLHILFSHNLEKKDL